MKYKIQFYYESECEAESTTDATFKLIPQLEDWLSENQVISKEGNNNDRRKK